jgi:hypothetical protein
MTTRRLTVADRGLLRDATLANGPSASAFEDGNRARHLYQRPGFEVVGRNGGSDTMLLNLG